MLFKCSCLHFFPLLPATSSIPFSHLDPTPFDFVHVSFIHIPWWPFPYFPPLSLSPSLLVTVSLFFISTSLVIFYLLIYFVDYVPFIDEIIWYLFFTTCLISLSIISPVLSIMSWRVGAPSFFLLHSVLLCKCTIVFLSIHLLMDT